MGFTFNDLDLTKVEVSGGGAGMPIGKHIVKISEAKMVNKPNGSVQVEVKHDSLDGTKTIRNWITVHNPNSSENARIGLEQFKALLVHGGHPAPNAIGEHGIASVNGLDVGVVVVYDDWKNRQEGTNNVYTKVKSYCDPKTIDPSFVSTAAKDPLADMAKASEPTGGNDDLDDDVPF